MAALPSTNPPTWLGLAPAAERALREWRAVSVLRNARAIRGDTGGGRLDDEPGLGLQGQPLPAEEAEAADQEGGLPEDPSSDQYQGDLEREGWWPPGV